MATTAHLMGYSWPSWQPYVALEIPCFSCTGTRLVYSELGWPQVVQVYVWPRRVDALDGFVSPVFLHYKVRKLRLFD